MRWARKIWSSGLDILDVYCQGSGSLECISFFKKNIDYEFPFWEKGSRFKIEVLMDWANWGRLFESSPSPSNFIGLGQMG